MHDWALYMMIPPPPLGDAQVSSDAAMFHFDMQVHLRTETLRHLLNPYFELTCLTTFTAPTRWRLLLCIYLLIYIYIFI